MSAVNTNQPSPELVIAHAALNSDQRIADCGPLEAGANDSWIFRIKAHLVQPNVAGLPCDVALRVEVPNGYPYVPVNIFSESPEVTGFNHQDAETHKLCLREERLAPCNHHRLSVYIDWALDWLTDAANLKLLPKGHPFELPDFSRKLLKAKLPTQKMVWFSESIQSLPSWNGRVGQTGEVTLLELERPRVILATSFTSAGDAVFNAPFSSTYNATGAQIAGRWALLPSLAIVRNKPPQTFGELRQLFNASDMDLNVLLQDLWFSDSGVQSFSILMVGAMIPRISGEPPCEVHWQPLVISNASNQPKIDLSKLGPDKRQRAWRRLNISNQFLDEVQLPWLPCENIAPERLYSRGMLESFLRQKRITLVGCGAIGSCLADQLIRSGATDVSLIDKEDFEPGNHARHVLSGEYQYIDKAKALKIHLQMGSPYAHIYSYRTDIPNFKSADGPTALAAINECDVLIDCTANESVFQWLSQHAASLGKCFIHMFISFDAKFLTLIASGRDISASLAMKSFSKQSATRTLPDISGSDLDEYLLNPTNDQLVIPGAGCWHPTFPARWNHILMLVGAALDMIEKRMSVDETSSGYVAILKRNELDFSLRGPAQVTQWIYRSLHR
jgi:hypothetical protein